MTKDRQNKSLIKQNILQYLVFKGISKYEFYKKTGIARGTLDNNSGLSEDGIAKFIVYFPEVNVKWLLTGKGDMLTPDYDISNESNASIKEMKLTYNTKCKFCLEKERIIEALQAANFGLRLAIDSFQEKERNKDSHKNDLTSEPKQQTA